MHLSHLDTFQNEEMELAISEWFQILQPGFYSDGKFKTRANIRQFLVVHQLFMKDLARCSLWKEVAVDYP
jgi:hypothetical protein